MIYTDTWSPRRQAAATAALNSGRGAAHLQSPGDAGAGGARKGHSHNAATVIHLKLRRVPVTYFESFPPAVNH